MASFSNIDQATRFRPTTEAASDILAAMVDPDQTLSQIAERFQTTVDALSEWLESPPIIERIDAIERAAARRNRLIAIGHERLALSALISILEGHRDDELNLPVNNQSLKAVVQRDRRRATARLAANQLIRLAGPGGTGVPPVVGTRREQDALEIARELLKHTDDPHPTPASPEGRNLNSPTHGLKPMATTARRGGEDKKRKQALGRALSALPFLTSRERHNFGGLVPRDLLNACGGTLSGTPLFGRPIGAWIDGAA